MNSKSIVVNFLLTILLSVVLVNRLISCLNLNPFKARVIESVERIEDEGFTAEKHKVKTEDGYVLTLFRILPMKSITEKLFPNSKSKMLPAFLQHGFHGSSDNWIVDGTGLAFRLAREGYDVWLGNIRGNAYGREHVRLNPDEDVTFWNYSWHEHGLYDTTASIDYILKKTGNQQLHYIGHSMGTTMFFVLTSSKPRYNSKIRTMIALSPVGKMTKWFTTASNKSLVYEFLDLQLDVLESNGKYEMIPREDNIGRSSHQASCPDLFPNFAAFCYSFLMMLKQMVKSPTIPGGTSIKTSQHYLQLVGHKRFAGYDYNSDEKNMEKWGSTNPPEYDLNKITAPIAVFYSPSDELISEEDAKYMISNLPNVIKVWKAPDIGFSHFDFVFKTTELSAGARLEMNNLVLSILEERNF